MKKISLLVILILSTTFSVYSQQQYTAEKDFTIKIIDGGNSVEITGYVGTNTDVRIPPKIQGLPVTIIGEEAFRGGFWVFGSEVPIYNEGIKLTRVTIPNSVTTIRNYAFMDNLLTSVIIPNSVVNIGGGAFAANNLTNVTIPNSIKHISVSMFSGNQLTSITIPSNIVSIGDWAFERNPLISITIGSNLEFNDAFVYNFDDFYKGFRKRAGTYNYINGRWIFSQ